MARFDLTDFEWDLLAPADRGALGGYSGALWSLYDLREPLQPLAERGAVANIRLMPTRKRFAAFDAEL